VALLRSEPVRFLGLHARRVEPRWGPWQDARGSREAASGCSARAAWITYCERVRLVPRAELGVGRALEDRAGSPPRAAEDDLAVLGAPADAPAQPTSDDGKRGSSTVEETANPSAWRVFFAGPPAAPDHSWCTPPAPCSTAPPLVPSWSEVERTCQAEFCTRAGYRLPAGGSPTYSRSPYPPTRAPTIHLDRPAPSGKRRSTRSPRTAVPIKAGLAYSRRGGNSRMARESYDRGAPGAYAAITRPPRAAGRAVAARPRSRVLRPRSVGGRRTGPRLRAAALRAPFRSGGRDQRGGARRLPRWRRALPRPDENGTLVTDARAPALEITRAAGPAATTGEGSRPRRRPRISVRRHPRHRVAVMPLTMSARRDREAREASHAVCENRPA